MVNEPPNPLLSLGEPPQPSLLRARSESVQIGREPESPLVLRARAVSENGLVRVTSKRLEDIEKKEKEARPLTDREKLIQMLTAKGRGSFLRGWFRELDPDGSLDVLFLEFVEACVNMGFVGNIHELMGLDDDLKTLTLAELYPEADDLFKHFRDWSKETFGSFVDTFSSLDVAGRGKINLDMFINACKRNHFEATDEEITEIFNCLDLNFDGHLSMQEFIYLEKDSLAREQARIAEKKKQKEKHLKLMAYAYDEDGKKGLQPKNRFAPRPWLAGTFEGLPMLINQRRVEWQRTCYQKSLEARIIFVRHLRATYGCEARAWRVGLDPDCTFEIDAKVLNRYCRKADLKVDTAALWKSLDKDCDGVFHLEELCVRAADILASFQHWARSEFGSCVAIWDSPEMTNVRQNPQLNRWNSEKKILFQGFADALKLQRCPICVDPDIMSLLLSSLDSYGCGFIERSDLEWLDKYSPPEWLSAAPDEHAWNEMWEMMMRIYKHPLKAWRNLLDRDNSNNVSWQEFKYACRKLNFKGDIGGAWRVLNTTLASSITLFNYDKDSAELLASFKDWCVANFGSVRKAFKALDEHNSGHVSDVELRRACRKLKFSGDVKLLFNCLDVEGKTHGNKRTISLKCVDFLDDWDESRLPEEDVEDLVVHRAVTKKVNPQVKVVTVQSPTLPALPLPEARTRTLSSSCSPGGMNPLSPTDSRVSGTMDSDRLCRTYGCPSPARGKSQTRSRNLASSLSSHSPSEAKCLKKSSNSLPWLHKWMAIDREMC